MKNNSNHNLKLSILLIAVIITISTIFLTIMISNNNYVQNQQSQYLQSISEIRKNNIESFIQTMELRMVDFASDGKIKECIKDIGYNNLAGCQKNELNNHIIINKLPIIQKIEEISIIDSTGEIISSTNINNINLNVKKSKYFTEGIKKPSFQELYYSELSKKKQFSVSAPIKINNITVGVIVGTINPNEFYKILNDNSEIGGNIYIVNKDAQLINPSNFLKGENKGVLTQNINTINFIECQKDLTSENASKNNLKHQIYKFTDFRGIEVVGTHQIVPEVNWCILSEVENNNIFIKNNTYLIILYIANLSIISLIFFQKKRK
jgi:hypothetical protein